MKKEPLTLEPLTAVSPIDGRYADKTASLRPYLSEHWLIAKRVQVEIEYLIALSWLRLEKLPEFTDEQKAQLRKIYEEFSLEWSEWIKNKEKVTNHDVKSVEYYIKHKLEELGLWDRAEFVHFGLTSQDINNTATPLTIKDALNDVIIPQYQRIIDQIYGMAVQYADIPMLARTHGQIATPTNLGKEMMVFHERLMKQMEKLRAYRFEWKFGGATGNFNAHYITYPKIDWMTFADKFLSDVLLLSRQRYTTQISHYDDLAELFHILIRINNILLDFDRDVWAYISMDFFKQKIKEWEVWSSAMPHKVNPIDFENSEGNIGLSNAIFTHMAEKLPISRLQRDLSDSTVLRALGEAFGHLLIQLKSVEKWIWKLEVNEARILQDLDSNPIVIAEAIQTILRSIGYDGAYETLKDLTRWKVSLTIQDIHDFTDGLDWVPDDVKARLRLITPRNYTGIFPEIE